MKEFETVLIRVTNKVLIELSYYHSEINGNPEIKLDQFFNEADLTPVNSYEDVVRNIENFGIYFNIIFSSLFALLNNSQTSILVEANQRLENALLAFAEMPLLSSSMKTAVLEVIDVVKEVNFLMEEQINELTTEQQT